MAGIFDESSREYLKLEVLELRELLVGLTDKYRVAEDKRRVMEKRISNLIADNKILQEQAMRAEGRRILSEKEVATMQEKIYNFTQNNEVAGLKELLEAPPAKKVNASTSSTDIPAAQDGGEPRVGNAPCPECAKTGASAKNRDQPFEKTDYIEGRVDEHGNIVLSKSELNQLDKDMMELKEALERREESWAKSSERERTQRRRIQKMQAELQNMRNLCNFKTKEVDQKCKELTAKNEDLLRLRKEVRDIRAAMRNKRALLEGKKPSLPSEARGIASTARTKAAKTSQQQQPVKQLQTAQKLQPDKAGAAPSTTTAPYRRRPDRKFKLGAPILTEMAVVAARKAETAAKGKTAVKKKSRILGTVIRPPPPTRQPSPPIGSIPNSSGADRERSPRPGPSSKSSAATSSFNGEDSAGSLFEEDSTSESESSSESGESN